MPRKGSLIAAALILPAMLFAYGAMRTTPPAKAPGLTPFEPAPPYIETSVPSLRPTIRVAAIQFHSRMGKPEVNRVRLAELIKQAAGKGAKIVVLPEAAVSGYASISRDIYWASKPEPERGYIDVRQVAETVPGPSTKFFAGLADDLAIYLTVPLVEKRGETFYNTVVLLGPEGRIRAHYRKQHLWPQADSTWATAGPPRTCVLDTEYGRLGVMICYDVHGVLPKLIEAKADIVLYSVAWWGPNAGGWFENTLARQVGQGKLSLILANWTFPADPGWSGHGSSMVIGPDGTLRGRTTKKLGNDIVIADVPVRPKADKNRRE